MQRTSLVGQNWRQQHTRPDLRRAALAGTTAIAAWIVAQWLDITLTSNNYDDVQLLGTAFGRVTAWKSVGFVIHTLNGVLFGITYATVAEPRLSGPGWRRGLIAAEIECLALSTLTPLVDRWHPAVRDGRMAPMATPLALLQAIWRHAVFGVVLGTVYRPKPKA